MLSLKHRQAVSGREKGVLTDAWSQPASLDLVMSRGTSLELKWC